MKLLHSMWLCAHVGLRYESGLRHVLLPLMLSRLHFSISLRHSFITDTVKLILQIPKE